MPFYDFIEDGKLVTRYLKIDERDTFPGRIMPSRIAVCPKGEPTQEDGLLQGWKEIEEKDGRGARELERSLGLTADKVKDAMLAPTRPEPRWPED